MKARAITRPDRPGRKPWRWRQRFECWWEHCDGASGARFLAVQNTEVRARPWSCWIWLRGECVGYGVSATRRGSVLAAWSSMEARAGIEAAS